MKLHFEPNLPFQKEAIQSVTDLFEGSPYTKPQDRVLAEVPSNILKITPEKILENYKYIALRNGIKNVMPVEEMDFSVEMETGTGKTYVYLRTIFELNRTYGLNKFIIIVPSIAVKEGVLKTLDITKEHFAGLYNSVPYNYFQYDSKKLSNVRGFVFSNHLQIMVTNIQAFNTDERIINQERDTNNGERLIDLLRKTNPILVMDEPQEGMDTSNSLKRIETLNPLFKLRYSATHKVVKNLVYQLTPFDAYNQGLVKKIEVFSIHESNTQSNVHIEFKDIKLTSDKPPQAKLELNHRLKGGDFKTKIGLYKIGDDLEKKTNHPVYKGWIIERILKDPMDDTAKVKFGNGNTLTLGSKHGWNKEGIFREQIRWTIKKHFDKKDNYKNKNIKVLSLFFIDRVANYIESEGIIRKLFNELFIHEYKSRYGTDPVNSNAVHGGYFAKTNSGEYTDNESSMQKNKEIYDLILKDKERLLSLNEPLEFIFSHSALGVGWDNPNVFNICTLNESESIIKKRQEIGRGLRICVDQDGSRYYDSVDIEEGNEINLLTVIANQSYYAFSKSYQEELREDLGTEISIVEPRNARKEKTKVKINRPVFESEDFKKLWKNLSKKTQCKVAFREEQIIEKCIEKLNNIIVPENIISIELNKIKSFKVEESIEFETENKGQTEESSKIGSTGIDFIEEIIEATALSLETVITIFEGIENKHMLARNPVAFITDAIKKIQFVLQNEMVRLVDYKVIESYYSLDEFKDEIETYQPTINTDKGVYDKLIFDSQIEEKFGMDIDRENKIRMFVKLPDWYIISTPIGKYTPDFALVVEKKSLGNNDKTSYYFVIETKGSDEWNELKENEKLKIKCAIKHFEAIGIKEYLAPIDNINKFKEEANKVTNDNIF